MQSTKSKIDTSHMASRLSGRASRISITPADNGYVVDTDLNGDGPENGQYQPPRKAVYEDLDGVKGHLDRHLPSKVSPGGKSKPRVIDTGKKPTKIKVIDVGAGKGTK